MGEDLRRSWFFRRGIGYRSIPFFFSGQNGVELLHDLIQIFDSQQARLQRKRSPGGAATSRKAIQPNFMQWFDQFRILVNNLRNCGLRSDRHGSESFQLWFSTCFEIILMARAEERFNIFL
jgi:hypothetical protein